MRKAAIFDLDGTLISGTSSESIFVKYLFKKGEISLTDIFRTFLKFFENMGPWNKMVLQNKYYLKGGSPEKFRQIADECFFNRVDRLISKDMIRIIRYHRDKGDLLIIISGTLNFILDVFNRRLSFDDKKGTDLEVKDGEFTGRISGIHPRGHDKVVVLEEFIKKYQIDLANSTVYANHFTDRLIMEKVGNPVAVNPDRNLLKYAKNRRWKILNIR